MLSRQLDVKDRQIAALSNIVETSQTTVREQNALILGFQRLFGLKAAEPPDASGASPSFQPPAK